jgi:hypothetical protein
MRSIVIVLLGICFLSCNQAPANTSPEKNSIGTDTAKHNTADSLKSEISAEIKTLIKSGFYDREETFDSISDMFNEKLDEPWIKEQIEKEYAKRLKEQHDWPEVTDFDKLVKAFDKLNSSHIIALHNYDNTREEGEEDTKELHDKLKTKGINTIGYCFYHTQDVDRVAEEKVLFIAFGDFENNDKKSVEIGQAVVKALLQQGFKITWNNSADTRIEITNIKWQKRFGNKNCSYERSVKLLSGR